jgi:ABC-type glycerol-3-phosphate transport system permease component
MRRIKASATVVVFHYLTLTAASAVVLVPIVWAMTTSLKPESLVVTRPPRWIPDQVTFQNYYHVIFTSSFGRYFLNSLVVAATTVVLCLAVASHCSYASVRFSFKGRDTLLLGILASGMIPGIAILVPLYLVAASLGLLDTHVALVLIYAGWLTPATVWMLRGFFESVSPEIEEAALVDGCSRLRAFYTMVLPLSLPGLAAASVYVFIESWNEFLIATSLTSTADMRLLTVGLYQYVTTYGVEWGLLTAGVLVALVPVLIIFMALQRLFIQGLTAGATKG